MQNSQQKIAPRLPFNPLGFNLGPQYQAPYRPPMQQASSQKEEWRVAFEAMTSAQNKFIASQNQFMNT